MKDYEKEVQRRLADTRPDPEAVNRVVRRYRRGRIYASVDVLGNRAPSLVLTR